MGCGQSGRGKAEPAPLLGLEGSWADEEHETLTSVTLTTPICGAERSISKVFSQ